MKKDSKEAEKMEEGKPQIIQSNEDEVQAHVDRLVKQTVEDFGLSKGLPAYAGGLLFTRGDKSLQVRRLLAVGSVGPARGHIWVVAPGDFYYVESENWPHLPTDKWQKLYRLQGGRMAFLKQFDFNDAGYGHILVDTNGVEFWQEQNNKSTIKVFAFPDLRELKFRNLNWEIFPLSQRMSQGRSFQWAVQNLIP